MTERKHYTGSAREIVTDLIGGILVAIAILFFAGQACGEDPPPEVSWLEESGITPLPVELAAEKAITSCPIWVPEDEIWRTYYSVTTNLSAWYTDLPCVRGGWWSGWHELEGPGVWDLPDLLPNAEYFDNAIFVIWFVQPIYSCEWLASPAVGGDCTIETHEALGFTTPFWYMVCPGWDAYPRPYAVCIFDDGFETGDASAWSREVP